MVENARSRTLINTKKLQSNQPIQLIEKNLGNRYNSSKNLEHGVVVPSRRHLKSLEKSRKLQPGNRFYPIPSEMINGRT